MKTFTTTSLRLAKTLVVFFGLVMVGILWLQSPQTSISAGLQTERVFESAIPKDVPIEVKIKQEKERSFKDLRNEQWVREFELEVKNTGIKPIYFLDLTLVTDVKVSGDRLVFGLVYGRVELGDITSKAEPDDVPIKPGDTYVFKIHPGQIRPWEKGVKDGVNPEATRLRAELQSLSFGDGTGYFGNHPYPPAGQQELILLDIKQRPNLGGPKARAWPTTKSGTQPTTSSNLAKPVNLLPADFLDSGSSSGLLAAPRLDGCLFDECVRVIPNTEHVCYNCPLQNRPTFYSGGVCKQLVYDKTRCELGNGNWYYCLRIDSYDCGFGPGPTPSPTPTPSPQPCLYCPDPNAIGPADCSTPSTPTCPVNQIQRFGCCYPVTCPSPQPTPPSCDSNHTPGPFVGYPVCDYVPPCVLLPPTPTPTPFVSGCTTPGFLGGCPPGLTPDGFGMCCGGG